MFFDSDDDFEIDPEDYHGHEYFDYMFGNMEEFYDNLSESDFLEHGLDSYDFENDDDASSGSYPSNEELAVLKRTQAICSKLNEDRKQGQFCDATITIGKESFPVHKNVVTASSSYFTAMFMGSFTEKNEKVIDIQGVSGSVFGLILDYLYGENIKLTFEHVKDVYMAADMLCIDSLMEDCKKFMKDNWLLAKGNDFPVMYDLVKSLDMTDMLKEIDRIAQTDLSRLSLSKDEFLELPYDILLTTLQNRDETWQLKTEGLMAENIMKWILHKPDERLGEKAVELLSLIKFEFVVNESYEKMHELFDSQFSGVKREERSLFKCMFEGRYKSAHKRIQELNIQIVVPYDLTNLKLAVLKNDTFKWEVKACPGCIQPISYLSDKNKNVHVFSATGGLTFNLENESVTNMPDFPEGRSLSTFCLSGNNLIATGGVEPGTGKPLNEILTLNGGRKMWHRGIKWFNSRCGASSIAHENMVYLVGGYRVNKKAPFKTEGNSECFAYNTTTRHFKKICKLQKSTNHPKLVVHNGILYVFSNDLVFPERVDLSKQRCLPTPDGQKLKFSYPILNVCPVDEGILIAYLCTARILLALLTPTDCWETEPLCLISTSFSPLFLYVPPSDLTQTCLINKL